MFVFVHAQGTKTVYVGGRGSKNGKIMSTQLLNAPLNYSGIWQDPSIPETFNLFNGLLELYADI